MTIRWANVIVTVLLLATAITLLTQWSSVGALFATLRAIGPGPADPGERLTGLLLFTVICAVVLCGLRILLNRSQGGPHP